jgi:hypothetical protein
VRHITLFLFAILTTGCLAAGAGAAGGAIAASGNDDPVEYYINTELPPDSIRKAMRSEQVIQGMSEAEARLTVQSMRRHKDEPEHVATRKDGTKVLYYTNTHFGPATVIWVDPEGTVERAETKRVENVDLPDGS